MFSTRSGVARLSIFSVALLILLKAAASIITGSISIRADAVHSVIDLAGVIIGYVGIRISSKPPDRQHAFGHGKVESIASAIIAGLIFLAAGAIAYEAVNRLISGGTLEMVALGIWVTAAAVVINGAVAWQVRRVARAAESVALEATARHMFTDVLSSVAVLAGLILVQLTGLNILDPVVALLVAALIVRTAYDVMRKSISDLIDAKLPEAEEEIIRAAIMEHAGELINFHALRTRKAGNRRYIDLHLVMPKDISVAEAHRMCDHLEKDIKSKLRRASLTIHVEPCGEDCEKCPVPPERRKEKH